MTGFTGVEEDEDNKCEEGDGGDVGENGFVSSRRPEHEDKEVKAERKKLCRMIFLIKQIS